MGKIIFYPDKLYEIRTKEKVTQEELAKAVGVSRTTFNKWENSVTSPKEKNINSIALFLKIERSEISNLPSTRNKDGSKNNSLLRIGRDIRLQAKDFEKKRDTTLEYFKEIYRLATEVDSFYFILDAIFRGTTYPIYIKNINNEYVTANNAFFDLFSLDYSFQISEKNDSDIFPKNEATDNKAIDQYVLDSNKIFKETKYLPNSSQKKIAIWTKVPMYDIDKNIIGLVGSFIDTTELERINRYQQRILGYFDKYFPDGILIRDIDTNVDNPLYLINKKRLDIWGITKETIQKTPKAWRAWIHPDDREKILDMHDNKGGINGIFRIFNGKNELKWIDEVTVTDIDEQGRKFIISINRDITEQKENETSLTLIKEVINKMDNSFFWIRTIDRKNNKILHISEGFNYITGYDSKEFLTNKKNIQEYIHPADKEIVKINNNKASKTGFASFQYRLKTKWGYKKLTTKIIQKKINGELIQAEFVQQN